MKTIIKIFFLCGIIVITAFSCEKKNDMNSKLINNESILGDWVNIILNQDTLFFINDTIIWRTDTIIGERKHHYTYSILYDSIRIQYTGAYYIYCPEKTFHISLDKQEMILTIENLNTYFPKYNGDKFKKLTD
jgi:hypothetical protein